MTWPATGRTRTRLACPQLEALHQSGPQQAGGRIGADQRLCGKLQGQAGASPQAGNLYTGSICHSPGQEQGLPAPWWAR